MKMVIIIKEIYVKVFDRAQVSFVLNKMILYIRDSGMMIIFMVTEYIINSLTSKMYRLYK